MSNTTALSKELSTEQLREEMAYEHSRCRVVQPQTLGYQTCRLEIAHAGAHRSQDGREYRVPSKAGADRG